MFLIEEYDKRFYLSTSTITNAGTGVFASEAIEKGDRLPIVGVRFSRNSVIATCTDYSKYYRFLIGENDFIMPMGLGGMINHSDERQNVQITHVQGYDLQMLFLRRVMPGEEILTSYGDAAEWIINHD